MGIFLSFGLFTIIIYKMIKFYQIRNDLLKHMMFIYILITILFNSQFNSFLFLNFWLIPILAINVFIYLSSSHIKHKYQIN
jgi:hypothetical protein